MTQKIILEKAKKYCRYLEFSTAHGDVAEIRDMLSGFDFPENGFVGVGPALCQLLDVDIEGFHGFPALTAKNINIPSTQADLLVYLESDEPGEVALQAMELEAALFDCFDLVNVEIGFLHNDGDDLTGYEDGTENPEGDDLLEAVQFVSDNPKLKGGCFVSVQRWDHDLPSFFAHPQQEQDHMIGRRKSDNEELDDAPDSAHVKRTAQESFAPEAFMKRRSMPWADEKGAGLIFTAFAKSLYPFEIQLNRMIGQEDGIQDALFRFSKPVTGGHYWCPPVCAKSLGDSL